MPDGVSISGFMRSPSTPSTPLPVYRGNASAPLTKAERIVAGAICTGCVLVLAIAVLLSPSPAGFGTHTELGLAECSFLARTGLPCPACGMTTSFAYLVRGNLAASLYIQPMGTVLAVLCGIGVWAGGHAAVTGRRGYRLITTLPTRYSVGPLLVLALAAWAWKMFAHTHGLDGWR